jgi:hypothetical protein
MCHLVQVAMFTLHVPAGTISTGVAPPSSVKVTVKDAGTMASPGLNDEMKRQLKFSQDQAYTCTIELCLVSANFDRLRTAASAARRALDQAGSLAKASPSDAMNAFDSLRSAATVPFEPGHMKMLKALESALKGKVSERV